MTEIKNKTKRNAAATRQRILQAAREAFLQASYEQVGVRDIAAKAGVDPSLINRYFVSKKNLFIEVLEQAFNGDMDGISISSTEVFVGEFIKHLNEMKDKNGDFQDLFGIILHSAVSPLASPIVSKMFHDKFISLVAASLKGSNREVRAALIGAYILGFRLMYESFGTRELEPASTVLELLIESIRPCVEGV